MLPLFLGFLVPLLVVFCLLHSNVLQLLVLLLPSLDMLSRLLVSYSLFFFKLSFLFLLFRELVVLFFVYR